jgi:phage recombination protein Bet
MPREAKPMSAEAKSLAVVENKMVVTSEQMKLARETVAKDLDDNQFALFCYNCTRLGIHPLDGLLVPIVRNDQGTPRLTFVNTVDLLRSRAAETGDYAGSDDPTFQYELKDSQFPSDAHATVWKFVQGEKCGFSATARWEEYYPGEGKPGFMWRNKPHVMLGKCAEALALRKAFPKQLSGLYISEELQKEIESPSGRAPARGQQQKQTPKPVGDVMCGECRAVNGHLPSCKYRKSQEAQTQAQEAEPEKKPDVLKWLVQVEAVDERERVIKDEKTGKEKSRTKYLMLTCFNAANENVTIYAWHTGEMRERLIAIPPKTKCIFMVKPQKSGTSTYYNVEEIVEITGEKRQADQEPEPPEES